MKPMSWLRGLAGVAVLAAAAAAVGAPEAPSLLPPGEPGTPLVVEGRITGPAGPVPRAQMYVYQTDARGYYSSEVNDDNSRPRLKARFATDDAGRFAFRTIMPGPYPTSGPPAHIHLEVTPEGRPLERYEIVFEGDPRISSAIRQDARSRGFFFICAPVAGPGGVKTCKDVTFRVH